MQRPGVGVAVFIIKNGKALFGYRVSDHGKDDWGLPGGKLDLGESWVDCAKRETLEECGVRIKNIRFLGVTNDVFPTGKHYVTIFMRADWQAGDAKVLEPDKINKWQWYARNDWPSPLLLPIQNLLKSEFIAKFNY